MYRRSWNVLCRANHLSAGFADMLRQLGMTMRCPETQKRQVVEVGYTKILCITISNCESSLVSPCLPQGCWVVLSDEKSTPLRGKDRLRNDPHEFPGFLD